MSRFKILLVIIFTIGNLPVLTNAAGSEVKTKVVQAFLEAFNSHDVQAMATLVTDDIKWYSITQGSVSTEVEGKTAFVNAMSTYFTSCPTCQSQIYGLNASAERVSVVEVANWMVGDEYKSQQSIAVYRFIGSQIESVYYFPAEPVMHAPATQTSSGLAIPSVIKE